jgi:hypothetical protein
MIVACPAVAGNADRTGRLAGRTMKAQTAQRSFPTALLTFSVMLLVLAIGFVVGRLVVAPAYLGAAPKIEAQGLGGSELDTNRAAPGHVYVPSPSGSPPPKDDSDRREGDLARGRAGGEAEGQQATEPEQVPEAARPGEQEPGRPRGMAPGQQQAAPSPRRGGRDGGPPKAGLATQEPPPSEEKSTRGYSIQVGVFSSLQGARQVVDDLARAGYPARISPEKRGSQALYRVVTGRYRSEYAARKALEQLRTEGFDAFLIEQ